MTDTNTNLPKLPESFFWEIKPDRISIKHGIQGDWEEDEFVRFSTKPGERETRTVEKIVKSKNLFKRLFGKTDIDYINEYRYYNETEMFAKSYRKYNSETEEYEVDQVLRSNVVERCKDVHQRWLEKIKHDAFYGNYPPKKLEV